MGEAATLIVVVLALLGAVHQPRENRRGGVGFTALIIFVNRRWPRGAWAAI